MCPRKAYLKSFDGHLFGCALVLPKLEGSGLSAAPQAMAPKGLFVTAGACQRNLEPSYMLAYQLTHCLLAIWQGCAADNDTLLHPHGVPLGSTKAGDPALKPVSFVTSVRFTHDMTLTTTWFTHSCCKCSPWQCFSNSFQQPHRVQKAHKWQRVSTGVAQGCHGHAAESSLGFHRVEPASPVARHLECPAYIVLQLTRPRLKAARY